MILPKLNYVFAVSFLSAADDGSWTPVRFHVRQSHTCKDSEKVLAGNIAARHLIPGEKGVKVQFLGLQEDLTRGGKQPQPESPITPMNCFTLTLVRD